MALRLIVGVLKRKFPNVPVITTDELQNLMKTSQARRKLVLLVSELSLFHSERDLFEFFLKWRLYLTSPTGAYIVNSSSYILQFFYEDNKCNTKLTEIEDNIIGKSILYSNPNPKLRDGLFMFDTLQKGRLGLV